MYPRIPWEWGTLLEPLSKIIYLSYQLDPASGATILHVRRQSICAIPAPRNIPINCNKTNHQCNYRTNRHYATELTPRRTQNHYSHGYTPTRTEHVAQ
jgi:hypothetical protein